MVTLGQALQAAATKGDFSVAEQFFAELGAAHQAKLAAQTKVVAWTTASGKVAVSQPKTPADAEGFAASLRLAGKANVEILDK